MNTEIGITRDNRQAIAIELEKLIADETVLYIKTKNAFWNVEGSDFYSIRIFFKSQIEQLDDMINAVDERIRTIGHYATATMKSYLRLTHLTETTSENNDSTGFIKELLIDHESIIIHLREYAITFSSKYHDSGSSDFITGIIARHEKMAWILRSHLKQ